jgi:hypothetical protein
MHQRFLLIHLRSTTTHLLDNDPISEAHDYATQVKPQDHFACTRRHKRFGAKSDGDWRVFVAMMFVFLLRVSSFLSFPLLLFVHPCLRLKRGAGPGRRPSLLNVLSVYSRLWFRCKM